MAKKRPDPPPPGPPEWYIKGFPRHKNPNWWQKIENFLFTGKR